jgi:hypothetical protein
MLFLIFCQSGKLYVSLDPKYTPSGETVVRVFNLNHEPKSQLVTTISATGATANTYTATANAGRGAWGQIA